MVRRTTGVGFLLLSLALGNAFGADGPSPALSDAELAELLSSLDDAQDGLMGRISGLTDTQWRFKQNPDRWSVGECVEHIVLAESRLLGKIKQVVAVAFRPGVVLPHRRATGADPAARAQSAAAGAGRREGAGGARADAALGPLARRSRSSIGRTARCARSSRPWIAPSRIEPRARLRSAGSTPTTRWSRSRCIRCDIPGRSPRCRPTLATRRSLPR